MFSFLRPSAPKTPSAAICRAVAEGGLPPWVTSASTLRVVQSRGRYSNRKVTYIRVFDPVRAAERSLDVRRFTDLDMHQDLVLRSGHVEEDGIVIMSRRPTDGDAPSPVRTRAGRPVPDADPAAKPNEDPRPTREPS